MQETEPIFEFLDYHWLEKALLKYQSNDVRPNENDIKIETIRIMKHESNNINLKKEETFHKNITK